MFKGELKLLQLFVLTLPHWLRLPLLLLRELFRLCAQTRECLIHPELPPWSRNKSPTSILHGVQAPHFQLCWSTTVGSLLRARSHFSLTCFIYYLLPKHHQLQSSSLCFTSSHLFLGGVLLIRKKMQPCRTDFMLLLQVTGILVPKIMHVRLIGDSKLPLTMK